MPADAALELRDFQPAHAFFIGIDSDGCAFDTMEIKHKECFIPNIIEHWDLQAVSKFAREAAEFVNLYSKWRGINRFPALLRTFELLAEREPVRQRGVVPPAVTALRHWVATEKKLGNPALEQAALATGAADLAQALRWSQAVNEAIARVVHGVPPFPFVRDVLRAAEAHADLMVVSATPHEALVREWEEHGIRPHVRLICGQEQGTKKEVLGWATRGRYAPAHVLMIGDAPGDFEAARANGALFYPINPGHEEGSWERFAREGLGRFLRGEFEGEYQAALHKEFDRYLPDRPPWAQP